MKEPLAEIRVTEYFTLRVFVARPMQFASEYYHYQRDSYHGSLERHEHAAVRHTHSQTGSIAVTLVFCIAGLEISLLPGWRFSISRIIIMGRRVSRLRAIMPADAMPTHIRLASKTCSAGRPSLLFPSFANSIGVA